MTLARRESAVVAREHDDRVIREPRRVDRVEHHADRGVHRFDHAGVHRVLLHEPDLPRTLLPPDRAVLEVRLAGAVLLDERLGRHERRVHAVEREHREERVVPMIRDERRGLAGESIGEMFTHRSVLEPRVAIRREVLVAPVRPAPRPTAAIDLEALILGPEAFAAEMPLAREERAVAGFLKTLGDRAFAVRKCALVRCGQQRPASVAAEPVGRPRPRRMASGHERTTGRAAYRRRRISLREPNAASSEPLEIRRLVERVGVVGGDVRPSQVVREDHDDVGRSVGRGGTAEDQAQGDEAPREGDAVPSHPPSLSEPLHPRNLLLACSPALLIS